MRFIAAILFVCCLCLAAAPAYADLDSVQAREVARNNNCTPSKVDVYQQTLGSLGNTVYKIDCTLPKMLDEKAAKTASSLLVSCRENLCELVRPMAEEKK